MTTYLAYGVNGHCIYIVCFIAEEYRCSVVLNSGHRRIELTHPNIKRCVAKNTKKWTSHPNEHASSYIGCHIPYHQPRIPSATASDEIAQFP
jgi:hypothetical protein